MGKQSSATHGRTDLLTAVQPLGPTINNLMRSNQRVQPLSRQPLCCVRTRVEHAGPACVVWGCSDCLRIRVRVGPDLMPVARQWPGQ